MKIPETPQIMRIFEGKFASLVLFSTDGLKTRKDNDTL